MESNIILISNDQHTAIKLSAMIWSSSQGLCPIVDQKPSETPGSYCTLIKGKHGAWWLEVRVGWAISTVCMCEASISRQQHPLAVAICAATSLPASHLFPSYPLPLASHGSNAWNQTLPQHNEEMTRLPTLIHTAVCERDMEMLIHYFSVYQKGVRFYSSY